MNHSETKIVLGAGTAIVDLLARVGDSFLTRELPDGRGGTTWIDAARLDELIRRVEETGCAIEKAPGGSTGNLLCGLSGLGIPTRFLGWLGRDEDGQYYRDTFEAAGGDPGSFKYHADLRTGRCLSLITPDADRTMATCLGAAAEMRSSEITPGDFAGVGFLHTEGYLCGLEGGFLKDLLAKAKDAGIGVSFDLASFGIVRKYRSELRNILRENVELVFANELEAAEFSCTNDPEAALNDLASLCPAAAVKLGPLGSIVRMHGQTHRIPPEPANPVDATGAGDLWQAGFLYGYLHGAAPEICGRIGSILGAAAVSTRGARLPETGRLDLHRRIQRLINQP